MQNKPWTTEQAQQWYARQPLVLGCNYLPASAVNTTEMWQADTYDLDGIDRELRLAAAAGLNAVRVFLQYWVWKADPLGLSARFAAFLDLAEQHGMLVVPVLFDDCAFAGCEPYLGPQRPPLPGVHNSGWTPSPGFHAADDPAEREGLRAYAQHFVRSFGMDARVLFWDLYNEPGNSGRGERALPLLRDVFAWARETRPGQPLTAGVWRWPEPGEAEWEALRLSDVVSFHCYLDLEGTQQVVERLKSYGRPLFCTEWLHRPAGSRVSTQLPLWASNQTDNKIGSFCWGLCNGRTQTHLSWNAAENEAPDGPAVWQHDLFRSDGSPYDPEEIACFRSYAGLDAAPPVSRCGTLCTVCSLRAPMGCEGCAHIEQPFWGECPLKRCCEDKGLPHCGACGRFPCPQLTEMVRDGKHRAASPGVGNGRPATQASSTEYSHLPAAAGVNLPSKPFCEQGAGPAYHIRGQRGRR